MSQVKTYNQPQRQRENQQITALPPNPAAEEEAEVEEDTPTATTDPVPEVVEAVSEAEYTEDTKEGTFTNHRWLSILLIHPTTTTNRSRTL